MPNQPVPKVTEEDVLRILRRDFPVADHGAALRALEEYARDAAGGARVQLAAMKLASGSLSELQRHLAVARQDYRDILAAAEYPAATEAWSKIDSLTDAQRQSLFDSDWSQYHHWFDGR